MARCLSHSSFFIFRARCRAESLRDEKCSGYASPSKRLGEANSPYALGLIPCDIDAAAGRILWLDLEQYHYYQGFFQDALDSWAALRGTGLDSFTSPLDVLDSITHPRQFSCTDCLYFSRRSMRVELSLAQILARSRDNMSLRPEAAAAQARFGTAPIKIWRPGRRETNSLSKSRYSRWAGADCPPTAPTS